MTPTEPGELILIRHAPADHGGRLIGRTDVAALVPDAAALGGMRAWLSGAGRRVASPARRCRETAEALFGAEGVETDERLWEQDFGRLDGVAFADVPDLGPLSREALAAHRWEGGENFEDVVTRVAPALRALAEEGEGPVVVVAHAGTVRAALALALGAAAPALAFVVDPLSVTRVRLAGDAWSVAAVNVRVP